MGDTDRETPARGKVAKLIDRYDLDSIGDELEAQWTRTSEDRKSLRELADVFNRTVLRRHLEHEGARVLDGEIDNYYRLLTDDDVSSGTRVETVNRLSERGIDVERLQSEFVSRQALHTYLTKARGVSYSEERSEEERLEKRIRSIQRLKSRASAVAERALEEFHGSGLVTDGNVQVSVLVRAQCQDCGRQYPFVEFVRSGACECADR